MLTRSTIYLAGPLFTAAERKWNAALATELRAFGHDVLLPQEVETTVDLGESGAAERIFQEDVRLIDASDVVVACMDGADPDSGTCWECGYAYAKGKRVLTYRTDMRALRDPTGAAFNLMLTESSEPVALNQTPWTLTPRDLAQYIYRALASG